MLSFTMVFSQTGFHEFSTAKKFFCNFFGCRSGGANYDLAQIWFASSEKQDAWIPVTDLMLIPFFKSHSKLNKEKRENLVSSC